MCLAQGHNTVTPVRLEPKAPWSQVKHSTTVLPSINGLGNWLEMISDLHGKMLLHPWSNIGITHVFSCINICRVPRKLFEYEVVRPSVQT